MTGRSDAWGESPTIPARPSPAELRTGPPPPLVAPPHGPARHRAAPQRPPVSSRGGDWVGRATRRRRQQAAKRRRLLEWPVLVVVALLVAVIVRAFVLQTFYIPSSSMYDTLHINDRVLVNKLSYDLHPIHRGDVVVFSRPPKVQITDKDLIKRVIGVPGDVLQAHGGSVYVDGRKLSEPYVRPLCHGTADFGPVRVPKDDIFMMGDNRCNSYDSRFFGPISQKLVVGRAFALIWPLDRVGAL